MPQADAYRDPTSQFFLIDGMHVHFKREGKGAPVVLLHGSGSSLHCFDEVVKKLTDDFEVIRLDLPGFGLTGPRPDRDYRIDTYVSLLKKFVDKLKISYFVLGGNSLGGNIAWNYALNFPNDVRHLILMNATGYPQKSLPLAMRLARNPIGRVLLRSMISRRSTRANLRKLMGNRTAQVDEAMVDRVYAMIRRPGNLQAFIDIASTTQRDRSKDIPAIRVPTLVLRGESIDGQFFARDIPRSQEIVYQGVGHLMPDEVPSQVALAIRSI